jgi:hypothetical protein
MALRRSSAMGRAYDRVVSAPRPPMRARGRRFAGSDEQTAPPVTGGTVRWLALGRARVVWSGAGALVVVAEGFFELVFEDDDAAGGFEGGALVDHLSGSSG